MILKRSTPAQMFATVRDFWTAHPGPLSGEEETAQRFFVVPCYRAVLRADPTAIRNFFTYMSLGGSRKAKLLKPWFQAACYSRIAYKAAVRAGFIHGEIASAPYPGVRWSTVDALVAQWQFVACFSLSEQLVSHCLLHPKYVRCLRNEVEGRKVASRVMPVPEIKSEHMVWPSGWTESIVMGSLHVDNESDYFQQVQAGVLGMYAQTRDEVNLREYVDSIETISRARYEEGDEVLDRISQIIDRIKHLTSDGDPAQSLPIARSHGDLSPGQVLVEEGTPYLIDWSESEIASVTYDLVYTAIFTYGWRDFLRPIDVPELATLRRGLGDELSRYAPAVLVGLMLAEMGAIQYVDYGERRGTRKGWLELAERFFEVCTPDAVPSLVTLQS